MVKIKKKLTNAQKRSKKLAKAERQRIYQWVFINGKQVRIKRPPTIDGMGVEEFIQNNADPIWLHQNEMWEYMEQDKELVEKEIDECSKYIEIKNLEKNNEFDGEIPF